MKQSDFYPYYYNWVNGAIHTSNTISSIDVSSINDIGAPYYMGYLEYDSMPKMLAAQYFEYDGQNNEIIKFRSVRQNYSWGYVLSNFSGTTSKAEKTVYYKSSESATNCTKYGTSSSDYYFLNQVQMCNHSTANCFRLEFGGMIIGTSDLDENGTSVFRTQNSNPGRNYHFTLAQNDFGLGSGIVSIEHLKQMVNNEIPVIQEGSVTVQSVTFNFPSIYYRDFNEYNLAIIPINNGNDTLHVYLQSFTVYGYGAYYSDTNYRIAILPFVELPASNPTPQTAVYIPGSYEANDFRITVTSSSISLQNLGFMGIARLSGYFPYDINRNDFPDTATYNRSGVIKGQYVLHQAGGSSSSWSMHFYPQYDLKDVYNYLMLFHKININATTYSANTASTTYTTDYSTALFETTDNPKYERVEESYQAIVSKLRPWQMPGIDITNNTYTQDDKPEYEPPGPGDEGEEPDEGDWGNPAILSRTKLGRSAFSHNEVMQIVGLREFASQLWDAPADFWEALSVSRELSANINDYIIGCRAYPVALNVYNEHHVIHVGAGGEINMAAAVWNSEMVNWLQLGSITIPRQYKNFLDYNPYTSATIFLPFAGTFEINPKFLYDSPINLFLTVDTTDGSGVWVVTNVDRQFPILIKQCKVGIDIPISGLNATQMASNILNATMTTGQHAINAINRIGGTAAGLSSGLMAPGPGMLAGIATETVDLGVQALTDATNMAMGNKEIPYYTGGSGGAAAAEATYEPYITLRRPLCTNPENFAHTVGNLVNKTATISSLNGFTICRNVDVSGISQAVDKEKAQIKRILEKGFYA